MIIIGEAAWARAHNEVDANAPRPLHSRVEIDHGGVVGHDAQFARRGFAMGKRDSTHRGLPRVRWLRGQATGLRGASGRPGAVEPVVAAVTPIMLSLTAGSHRRRAAELCR